MTGVTGADGSPAMPRPAIGDHPTAMSLFGAIMLGLYDRELTGRGSKVSTSLLASGVWANACDLQAKICNATFPDRAIGTNPVNPLIHGYRSRDGKVFLLVQLDPECEFPRLCAGLGAAELATNPLFATVESRTRHAGLEYLEVDGKPAKMTRGGTPLVRAGRPGTPAGTLYTAFAIWCDGIDDGDSGSFLV